MGRICDKISKIMNKGTVICMDEETMKEAYKIMKEEGIVDRDDMDVFLMECVVQMVIWNMPDKDKTDEWFEEVSGDGK